MNIKILLLGLLWFFPYLAIGQDGQINNFLVKENLIKNDKLAIIAADTAENPVESISGTYQFVVNGFKQELKFHEGVAITPHAIEKSAFVFIKHINQQGSHGKLYYILKSDKGIQTFVISWWYLVVIPAIILLIAYLFKRLLVLAVLVLIGLFIFNYSKGLNLENIFETLVHGIKGFL